MTIEEAREVLRIDGTDNDNIINGLLTAIPDYVELCTGLSATDQTSEPLADTAGRFLLLLWYNAERAEAEKLQRTIDSLLKALKLKTEAGGATATQ